MRESDIFYLSFKGTLEIADCRKKDLELNNNNMAQNGTSPRDSSYKSTSEPAESLSKQLHRILIEEEDEDEVMERDITGMAQLSLKLGTIHPHTPLIMI